MKLASVQEQLRPAAEFALNQKLSADQAGRAFFFTLVGIALERCNGVQTRAAEMLGLSPTYLCSALKGRERRGRKARTEKSPAKSQTFQHRHGAPPAAVIGEMEI